jgi:hypothetical protein
MNLTHRKAGIALFAIAATMKAFNVSASEAVSNVKFSAFLMGQIAKHKDVSSSECIDLIKIDAAELIAFQEQEMTDE